MKKKLVNNWEKKILISVNNDNNENENNEMKNNVVLLISQIKVERIFDSLNSTLIYDNYNKQ